MNITEQNADTVPLKRRQFLKACGAGLLVWQSPLVFASVNKGPAPKVIWIILRGALDSLHTIIPTFDASYADLRPTLSKAFTSELLPLSDGYALHPSLKFMHHLFKQKQLLPVVAVGSGFAKRSHFEGQDFLESGTSDASVDSGWLGRALEIKNKEGIAIARSLPISMRGTENAKTWYPSGVDDATDDIYASLHTLYANDPMLHDRLNEGLAIQQMAMSESTRRRAKFKDLASSCGRLLAQDNGIDCAMLEIGGWDTHNNQANRLNNKLKELDSGLAALQQNLGDSWNNTVIMMATEFGRTAKENGTKGTDHGTGSAMFITGGAVAGGRVAGTWPGLKNQQLFNQRDLQPTSSSINWISTVLKQHWKFSAQDLTKVFPHGQAYAEKVLV